MNRFEKPQNSEELFAGRKQNHGEYIAQESSIEK